MGVRRMAQGARMIGTAACPYGGCGGVFAGRALEETNVFNREGIRLDAAAGLALTDAEFGDDGMEGMV